MTSQHDRAGDGRYSAPRLDLSINDFELIRVMGDGSLSTVFHAIRKKSGDALALKVIDKIYIHRHKMTDAVIRERNIMDSFDSPLVVRLKFTFQDSQKLYMGMELHTAGDLFEQIQIRKPLSKADAQMYAAEMVLILELLRQHQVVFRDFKPENLLVTESGHLAITDFGCAKVIPPGNNHANGNNEPPQADVEPETQSGDKPPKEKRKITFVGTADYLSPEILNNTSCTHGVDLWGFGCTLFQLITGAPPFRDKSQYLIMQRIADLKFDFPEDFPDTARDLVSRLLVEDPAERIGYSSLQEIKDHAFFEGIDWEHLLSSPGPAYQQPARAEVDADLWEMQALQEALHETTL
eukprot:jgi/Ulvmu1/7116/UM034_0022.1